MRLILHYTNILIVLSLSKKKRCALLYLPLPSIFSLIQRIIFKIPEKNENP